MNCLFTLSGACDLLLPPQIVHGVIDGVCDKQGPRYETFAKILSLADFSRLVRCVEALVKSAGRDGGNKQQVREGAGCVLHDIPMYLCTVS